MQTPFTLAAYLSWCAIVLVWLPGQFTSKKNAAVPALARQIPTTALLLVCFALLFNPSGFGLGLRVTPQNALTGSAGLVLDLAGVAVAIWARLALGRNWSGLAATVKEGHELVESGPYAIVRHPIYAGFLLAFLGTALTLGTLASYLGVAAGVVALMLRVAFEEKLMSGQFREAHAAYRRRTRKLIPFLW